MNVASVIAPIVCSSRDRSQALRHDPRRSRKTDDELARSNSGGLFGRWAGYGPFPISIPCTALLCVARFLGVIDARAVFMPLPEESSFSSCTSNTDTYFHKRLEHTAQPRHGFL